VTAIRALYRYPARRHAEHAAVIERVLAIPPKRHGKTLITFLTVEETDALIDAVDVSTWTWTARPDDAHARRADRERQAGRYRPPDSLLAFLEAL
jgi:hypothetical protein